MKDLKAQQEITEAMEQMEPQVRLDQAALRE